MSDNIAIAVKGVYKDFKLPHQKTNSIKSIFTGIHKRRTKTFEVQHALKDISFEVKKGEFFGIVGRNGSGKSTLLKIIAEIYQPTKGAVAKSGRLVPFIELGVGFNPELTGRENVYLNGALLGFSVKEIDAQYDDIVEFAELEQFMDQKLKNYSSGMQVRLAFSVATRAQADILLIDEVLAVGDSDFQKKCFDYFRRLKELKQTIIFVSHDMSAVSEFCDRAVLIDKSEMVDIGSADKIATAYEKLFLKRSTVSEGVVTKRWGDGAVRVDRVKVLGSFTKQEKDIQLSFDFTAHSDVKNAALGFTIRNKAGQAILGTNTKIINGKYADFAAGHRGTVEWSFPNIFNDGDYYVEPAIVHQYSTVADWWQEAGHFKIIDTKKTPHLVNPSVQVTISKIKG